MSLTATAPRTGWDAVVRGCAVVSATVAVGRGLAVLDRESVAIGVALAVAVGLTFWSRDRLRTVGWIAVVPLFVNQAAWMVTATWSLTHSAPSFVGAAVPSLLSVAALVGLGASFARWRHVSARVAGPIAVGAIAVVAILSAAVPAAGRDAARVRAGDIVVRARDIAFHPDRIEARAGDVVVVLRNQDLFWHTFTVNKLNASVSVATGGQRRLDLGSVGPGTYEFVCAIPGHESAGMTGRLVVR